MSTDFMRSQQLDDTDADTDTDAQSAEPTEVREQDDEVDAYGTTGYQTPDPEAVNAAGDEGEYETGYGLDSPVTPDQTTDTYPTADTGASAALDEDMDDGVDPDIGPAPDTLTGGATVDGALDDTVMTSEQATAFHDRLHEIQASFIDDPRQAAQDADSLLAEVAQEFCAGLDARRRQLGSAADSEDRSGTEDLRLAMQQYRGLVDSLLSC